MEDLTGLGVGPCKLETDGTRFHALFEKEMANHNTEQLSNSLPFDQSYWVIPNRLMAGCYPGSPDQEEMTAKLKRLVKAGISLIVNLMEPNEVDHSGQLFTPYQGEYKSLARARSLEAEIIRFPIRDLGTPTRPTMSNILDTIDKALESDGRVYIHCWGGRGRTGTVVGCSLMRHGLVEAGDVLAKIKHLRSLGRNVTGSSPETQRQIDMVLSWKQGE
jgi:hypothetical protein